MGAFFVYILKASACLAVFYLFYRLLLSRETFHRFNRIAILGILAASLLIPFCEVTIEKETEIHQTVLSIEQLLLLADIQTEAVSPTKEVTVTWIQILLIVYFLGILFFVGRNLYSFACLCLLLRSGRKEKLDKGITLVVHNKEELSPFSWMKYVVISQKDLDENGREILIHEIAHLRNRHSIDLFIADVCIFFQWFNPAAWLLKQELQNIHEFEADETVIKEGVNAKQYQLLLIKKAVGTRLYSMANSFNHSKLKKRITMMLKEKSSPWARLKYLYILPVAAIAVSAFARPEISKELNEISAVKVNDLVAIVETKSTEKELAVADTLHLSADTMYLDELAHHFEAKSEITLQFQEETQVIIDPARMHKADTVPPPPPPISVKSVNYKRDTIGDNIKVIGYGRMKGSQDSIIRSVTAADVKVIGNAKMRIRQFGDNSSDNSPLIVVDGEAISPKILNSIDPKKIAEISVLKDESLAEEYGGNAKNGIVIITLKEDDGLSVLPVAKKPMANFEMNPLPDDISIYIDGVKVTRGEYDKFAKDKFKSVSVYKDGVENSIWITTKENENTGNKIRITGTVKDESGNPVIGAAILEVSTNNGTITDLDGNFTFDVNPNAEIMVAYIGMQKVKVKAEKEVNVILKAE